MLSRDPDSGPSASPSAGNLAKPGIYNASGRNPFGPQSVPTGKTAPSDRSNNSDRGRYSSFSRRSGDSASCAHTNRFGRISPFVLSAAGGRYARNLLSQ